MTDLKQHPIIQQYIIWNRFGDLLGMDFEVEKKGHVIYRMTVKADHLATPFAAHGGSVAALIDAALGVACFNGQSYNILFDPGSQRRYSDR